MKKFIKIILQCFDELFENERYTNFYSDEWILGLNKIPKKQFEENFRMTLEVFCLLLHKIRSNTNINVLSKDLLIYFYYVCHIKTYMEMRDMFGEPSSNIFRTIKLLSSILNEIAKEEIKFPEEFEYYDLKRYFQEIGGDDRCILSIDGTHISISRPENPFAFYNRK